MLDATRKLIALVKETITDDPHNILELVAFASRELDNVENDTVLDDNEKIK